MKAPSDPPEKLKRHMLKPALEMLGLALDFCERKTVQSPKRTLHASNLRGSSLIESLTRAKSLAEIQSLPMFQYKPVQTEQTLELHVASNSTPGGFPSQALFAPTS